MSGVSGKVTACIVTHNSARFLERCLAALDTQTRRPVRVLVWDNASEDGSVARVDAHGAEVVRSSSNIGFALAANRLIQRTTTPYVLLLNPDACLQPSYIERLERAAEADPAIGSLTGKLLRPSRLGVVPVLDSTGHVLCRNRVPVNRGENEPDRGQYDTAGEVFGVCAAAALYRRTMLEDVRIGTDYFDSTFFVYLEDVDLDWRARLRGWKAYYEPAAIAEHTRGHRGSRRGRTTVDIRHSLKNRYLMILRNDRPVDLLPDLGVMCLTELLRLLDYLTTHPSSLSGYVQAPRLLPHAMSTRREIQSRRLVDSVAVRRWLESYPFARKLRWRIKRSAPQPMGVSAAVGDGPGDDAIAEAARPVAPSPRS
jgi:GT2 family glycosyltransferase